MSRKVSEGIRVPIRRDKKHAAEDAFDRLKTELHHAFAAPESSYQSLTVAEIIERNRKK